MNIFRQLRWKLTLSYTLVTVGALLVITLILGGIGFTRIFIPVQAMDLELMVDDWLNNIGPSSLTVMGAPLQPKQRVRSESAADTGIDGVMGKNTLARLAPKRSGRPE